MATPVLYSFRRCPYCMRAHMALKYSGLRIVLREVLLSDLPEEVLAVSPRATVPSLVTGENEYIDESWDIIKWALQISDPDSWSGRNNEYLKETEMLVETNDFSFKDDLDHYKYADRFPEHPPDYYRERCEVFVEELNDMLQDNTFLLAEQITVADIAIFPFIRQFAMVDKDWFDQAPYPELQHWVSLMLNTEWFKYAFAKHTVWNPGNEDIFL